MSDNHKTISALTDIELLEIQAAAAEESGFQQESRRAIANAAAQRAIEDLDIKKTSISFEDLNRIYALGGVQAVANKAIEFYIAELKEGKL